uniref:Uncharacterized protein n=1 Tax=uncultured marine virus TaxID=186617 RepID=A0A0F7L4H1_9VIRU|nr:hypothetical protein [uncultured marine virus]
MLLEVLVGLEAHQMVEMLLEVEVELVETVELSLLSRTHQLLLTLMLLEEQEELLVQVVQLVLLVMMEL